jgi:hypothetical protein
VLRVQRQWQPAVRLFWTNGLGQDNERTLAQTFRIPLRDPNITVRHYLHVVYPVVIDAGDECGIGSRRSDASFSGT